MNSLNSRQINAFLHSIRSEQIEQLGAQTNAAAQLKQAVDVLLQQQNVDDTPRQRGLLARRLVERAIQGLAADERERDHRAYVLLDAFYLQHKSRAETLALIKLAGGSFDRVNADALEKLTDALSRVCKETFQPSLAVIGSTPALRKGQHLPYRPYRVLWGRQREANDTVTWLTQTDAPSVVCLSGLGGNGKTALARHVAERLCESPAIADVLWISAKREMLVGARIQSARSDRLTFADVVDQLIIQTGLAEVTNRSFSDKCLAVGNLLRAKTFLIVLDNLDECENEIEITQQVLNILGTSRLLITSRHQCVDALPVVRPAHLTGLRQADSIQLLREESGYRGLAEFVQASPDLMREIHEYTGGAPLALHLVIGQAHIWSLPTVLAHLRQAREPDVEFYTFLFKQDWLSLSQAAQRILIYVGRMIRTSVTHAQLRHARIVESGLDDALELLVKLSLVETNASLLEAEKRYSVHPLVRHFVVSELPKLWTAQTI
ncbi:MAG: hypothetical protein HY868_27820 [Chloroflexi bacterium]|nr:hypothetical protein [Chloroflexota bacterium]